MPREFVAEYDAELNPVLNEAQLDKVIKLMDSKLRKVRSGAHEALASQLQALIQTTMRVARLPTPSKAMEYISNTTGGGYSYAQKRVITSGVGKAMTAIRGATQAETAAARAKAQEESRVAKMAVRRNKEQSLLERWFLKPRTENPLENLQGIISAQTDRNVIASNAEKAKVAQAYAKKQALFDIQRRDLLRQGLALRENGGTTNQLATWQNKVSKFADSWQVWAKQDKKNAQVLNTFLERAQNPTDADLARIGDKSSGGTISNALMSLGRRLATLGTLITAVKAVWKFVETQATVARQISMNPKYSKSGEIYARTMYGMSSEEYNSHARNTQLFGMRAAFGDVSENEWMALSLLRDGGRTYRALLSGDQNAVMASLESAFAKMPADQARYVASMLGYENILSAKMATPETKQKMRESAIKQGMPQAAVSAEMFNQSVQNNAAIHRLQGMFFNNMENNRRAILANPKIWGEYGFATKEMEEIRKRVVGGNNNTFNVNVQMENNFNGTDADAAEKTKNDIYRALEGMTFEEMQKAQQYNAGRAR